MSGATYVVVSVNGNKESSLYCPLESLFADGCDVVFLIYKLQNYSSLKLMLFPVILDCLTNG